jgi:hypothetical protein
VNIVIAARVMASGSPPIAARSRFRVPLERHPR